MIGCQVFYRVDILLGSSRTVRARKCVDTYGGIRNRVAPTESLIYKSFSINFHDSCRNWKNTLYFNPYLRNGSGRGPYRLVR